MCANTLVAVTTLRLARAPCTTCGGGRGSEEAHDRADAAFVREVRHQRRLDAAHRMAGGSEVRQQRAVVRSDVDDQLGAAAGRAAASLRAAARRSSRAGFCVVPLVYGYSGGNRIAGSTIRPSCTSWHRRAAQQLGRVRRLLVRPLPIGPHLVHRGQIAEKQHRLEIGRSTHLTAIDDDAAAGAGGAWQARESLGSCPSDACALRMPREMLVVPSHHARQRLAQREVSAGSRASPSW